MVSKTTDQPRTQSQSYVYCLFLCVSYIAVSAALIRFNKFLIHKDRFPFSMTLTALHMSCSLTCCFILYALKPSVFPGMAAIREKGNFTQLLTWFTPVGVLFAIGLWTSNQAYLYANVTFLQFMKEANVILVFSISCAVGLQVCDRMKLAVICWIIAGSVMCIRGEVHFTMMGFTLQLVSQFAECSRNVAGEWILTGSEFRLDPLTYTMLLAPVCLVFLIGGHLFTWSPLLLPRFLLMWHYLLPNALLAFTLNVIIGSIIKEISAVGFILSGLCKDIVLVVVSAALFGETVTSLQAIGFVAVLCGVFAWSFMKAYPHVVAKTFGFPADHAEKVLTDKTSATYGATQQKV